MGARSNPTLDAALGYVRAGLSIIPIRRGGSKAPESRLLPREMDLDTGKAVPTWNPFKERLPTEEELQRWYERHDGPGIAVVGGVVSGGLECIDFDVQAECIYSQWCELIEAEQPGLLDRLCIVRTPRPGFHVRYRCAQTPIPGSTKLAVDPSLPSDRRCLIETRGEAGYALAPGCPADCHETGRLYEHIGGPALADVQTITAAERETLMQCATSFDRAAGETNDSARAAGADLRPGDDFNRRGPDWSEVLSGWTEVKKLPDGTRYWRRPGKAEGWSATTGVCTSKAGVDLFACFSENADPFQGANAGRPCSCYSRFAAYTLLQHGGDYKAAAMALARLGYGKNMHTSNGRTAGTGHAGADEPTPAPWSEPAPLDEIPEAPPFPLEILPDPLRLLVDEVATALPCPPDYVAVPALVMAGAAIGASRAVAVKPGHVQRAVLYAAVVGSPGSAKSPAQEKVVEPAHETGERLHAAWEEKMVEYEHKTADYEAALKDAKRSNSHRPEKPTRPALERVTVNDATAESLVPILKENPRGVVLVRDELIAWVQAMNQYREGGKGADQQFWLSAWSGATVEVDRKKTHDLGPLRVRRPFIAVIGGLTPDKLPALRGDKPRHRVEQDGFIDRILMSYAKETPASEENWMEVSDETILGWRDIFAKLRTLAMVPMQEAGLIKDNRPFVVKLTSGGRRAWQAFTRRHAEERNAEDFPSHLIGPWSKLRGYCARLALIVRLLRWACGETDDANGDGDVDEEDMNRAARLVAYFKGHARKVYAAADADPKVSVAKKLLDWIVKGDCRTFNRRNAYRACRGPHCKTVADIDPILTILEEHGYIRPSAGRERMSPGRKPAPRYESNPAIFGQNGHNGRNGDPASHENERNGDSVHCVHSVRGSEADDNVNPPGKGDAWEGE